jgi:hypothetical protein
VNFPLISEDLEITFSNSFAQPISIEINGPQTVNAKFHTPYFVKYNASVLDSLSQERPRQNVL